MNFVAFGKEKGGSRGRKKEYDAPFRVDMILADEKTGKRLSDKMHFSFLQLPVFQKEEDECENDFERWIYILNNMETFQRMPFLAHIPLFSKLEETGKFISSLKAEEYEQHFELIKNYRDTVAVLNYAYEEGYAKGYEEGYAKGYAEEVAKVKAEVALNLFKLGKSIADIATLTELTEKEIETIIGN